MCQIKAIMVLSWGIMNNQQEFWFWYKYCRQELDLTMALPDQPPLLNQFQIMSREKLFLTLSANRQNFKANNPKPVQDWGLIEQGLSKLNVIFYPGILFTKSLNFKTQDEVLVQMLAFVVMHVLTRAFGAEIMAYVGGLRTNEMQHI